VSVPAKLAVRRGGATPPFGCNLWRPPAPPFSSPPSFLGICLSPSWLNGSPRWLKETHEPTKPKPKRCSTFWCVFTASGTFPVRGCRLRPHAHVRRQAAVHGAAVKHAAAATGLLTAHCCSYLPQFPLSFFRTAAQQGAAAWRHTTCSGRCDEHVRASGWILVLWCSSCRGGAVVESSSGRGLMHLGSG
jgi:hypothetical protein